MGNSFDVMFLQRVGEEEQPMLEANRPRVREEMRLLVLALCVTLAACDGRQNESERSAAGTHDTSASEELRACLTDAARLTTPAARRVAGERCAALALRIDGSVRVRGEIPAQRPDSARH